MSYRTEHGGQSSCVSLMSDRRKRRLESWNFRWRGKGSSVSWAKEIAREIESLFRIKWPRFTDSYKSQPSYLCSKNVPVIPRVIGPYWNPEGNSPDEVGILIRGRAWRTRVRLFPRCEL